MTAEELAEVEVSREIIDKTFSAEDLLDYIDSVYSFYENLHRAKIDTPEIVLTVGGLPLIISEALDMPDDKYIVRCANFSNSVLWRTLNIEAEYAK